MKVRGSLEYALGIFLFFLWIYAKAGADNALDLWRRLQDVSIPFRLYPVRFDSRAGIHPGRSCNPSEWKRSSW